MMDVFVEMQAGTGITWMRGVAIRDWVDFNGVQYVEVRILGGGTTVKPATKVRKITPQVDADAPLS